MAGGKKYLHKGDIKRITHIMNNVSVILVTYNSADVVVAALQPVMEVPCVTACYVVDNQSNDGTCQLVHEYFPQAHVVKNQENIGFGAANNLALEQVNTPYALLLNPDTVITQDAIEKLVVCAERYPQAAIIAPMLKDAAGRIIPSFKRQVFFREHHRSPFIIPEGDISAEFLSGAVWLVRMDAIRQICMFDPNIFLYYEDDDLCLRARQTGYDLIYTPHVKVTHLIGKSTFSSVKLEGFKQHHMIRSRLYLEQKYRGVFAAKWLGLRLAVMAGMKALGYLLLLKRGKMHRYMGRMIAACSYLMGGK